MHFTFHDVSINTITDFGSSHFVCTLHSTMFLLIRCVNHKMYQRFLSLHSTMFLLIHRFEQMSTSCPVALHSTMFLLIHGTRIRGINLYTFTFHDVSINTNLCEIPVQVETTLHSTMFLLILHRQQENLNRLLFFTFHDVSINTRRLFILTIQI